VWPYILAWFSADKELAKLNWRIEMAPSTIARKRTVETEQRSDVAVCLGLAASPTFVLMAWILANDAEAMMCSPAVGVLPIGGMAWMYLLMSLFHLSPWLRLASGFMRPPIQPTPQI
jgi:hypothetical protein